jgi:Flp pilus assembly protein TadG
MPRRKTRFARRGTVVVLLAVCLVLIVGMAALAIDLARVNLARAELQSAADSAALAGAGVLLNEGRLKGPEQLQLMFAQARATAAAYAARNPVMGQALSVDLNAANASDGEIVIGYLGDPTNHAAPLVYSDPAAFNTIRVQVFRNEGRNGSIAMTFAQLLGHQSSSVAATAAASFQDGIVGFSVSEGKPNAELMPFALHVDAWIALLRTAASTANDGFRYDPQTHTVSSGSDGIPELNIYPGGGSGQLPPGNFGTVDIGSSNNSTADISRQIRDGVSAADLAYFGGELCLGPDGMLLLNGDTGLSAAVKDDVRAILGQPRVVPLFRCVAGPGNNSYFTIVGFAGLRVVEVELGGSMSHKRLMVQPAPVVDGSALSGGNGNSYYVYRPIMLSR